MCVRCTIDGDTSRHPGREKDYPQAPEVGQKRTRNINMRFTDQEMEAIWKQMLPHETQTATVRRLLSYAVGEREESVEAQSERELLPRFSPH